jgi:hypothetical protein
VLLNFHLPFFSSQQQIHRENHPKMSPLRRLNTRALALLAFILALMLSSTLAFVLPVPSPTSTDVHAHDIRAEMAHKPGTCSPSHVWSVIQPISTLGATCCPDGYKSQQAILIGNSLAGVFCCPKDDKKYPCDEGLRKLPQTPVVCPSPGVISGALCKNYYW